MKSTTVKVRDEEEILVLGKRLAESLPDNTVVALIGTLGAGKTRLVQAAAEASGVPQGDVVSPTFVMVQQYHGNRTISHFDAYRVKDDDEFLELGPDEYFEAGGLTFVEWADRVEACLPPERIEIRVEVTGDTTRDVELRAIGSVLEATIDTLAEQNTA